MRVCGPSFFLSSLQLVSSVNPDPTLLSLSFSTHCLSVHVSPVMDWITHLIYLTQHQHTHFSVSCSTFHFIFIFHPTTNVSLPSFSSTIIFTTHSCSFGYGYIPTLIPAQ